ncbi:hypothetical protein M0805_008702 [Coniferiporia weirii]|nr:hypothetical protein M0805_008702 [Coniferiporia weirii]
MRKAHAEPAREPDRTDAFEMNDDATVQDVERSGVLNNKCENIQKEDTSTDGGLWGWLAVFGGWLIQVSGFGYTNAFGVYQDFYVREYLTKFSSSQISWIGSTQVFLMLTVGILAGRLFDKGYFYLILIPGSALFVFSLFMLSLAKPEEYYQVFLAHGVGVGIGSGLSYVPSVALLAQHFKSRHMRALTMSLVASGSSFGGIIHPIMLNILFNGSVGFANGVRASAGLITGCLVIAISVMRLKKTETTKESEEVIPLGVAVKKFSRDTAYIYMVLSIFLLSQGLFFPIFYLQLDATVHGVNSNFAFYSLPILNAASMVGRILPGFLSRKVGLLNMLIITSMFCAVVIFGMLGIHALGSVAAIGVLFGLFSGSYVTLIAPMLTMLADHPSEIGARIGFGFSFQGLGGLIGTPIMGALLTTDYIWWRPIVYGGVLCASSTVTYAGCRYFFMRKRGLKGWII